MHLQGLKFVPISDDIVGMRIIAVYLLMFRCLHLVCSPALHLNELGVLHA